jgi:hypothetical protein
MSKEYLATYLNDHLTCSVQEVEILDHLADEIPDLAVFSQTLKPDIEADRQQLQTLMDRLNVSESRVRKVGGWVAERFAEVKLTMDDKSRGPLRRLERLEVLALGIEGKIALWRALGAAADIDSQLSGVDYEHLVLRAKEQRRHVEVARLEAARLALPPKA